MINQEIILNVVIGMVIYKMIVVNLSNSLLKALMGTRFGKAIKEELKKD